MPCKKRLAQFREVCNGRSWFKAVKATAAFRHEAGGNLRGRKRLESGVVRIPGNETPFTVIRHTEIPGNETPFTVI